ncbi:MAG TPA: RiPP maturation radical SAM C-methyltransferase [Blastocatellia bacterium]|nr:RiPP maturation radical SAM C-methyltransferase [Blastocatellia bacterium]
MAAEIALVNMPFFSISRPSLGLSLLKPGLDRLGYSSDIHYLNLSFASLIGYDLYNQLECRSEGRLALEWTFAESLWDRNHDRDQEYLECLRKRLDGDVAEQYIPKLMACRGKIDQFYEQAMNDISWDSYKVIGFSSMFQQQMASLGMAQRLKQTFPDLFIIFGGANCEGPMGSTLLKSFTFIDAVCSGEGDISFPSLIRQLFGKGKPRHIAGILRRDDHTNGHKNLPIYNIASLHGSKVTANVDESDPPQKQACHNDSGAPDHTAAVVAHIDELPYPDFKDYFDQMDKTDFGPSVDVSLPFETSRGCWWGERHHCTFCGLNGTSMAFRHKSPRRAIDELKYLVDRYGYRTSQLTAVDNILPMSYFNEVLPSFGELGLDLFYETKSNLREEHVAALRQGNVRSIQPGIESLSTPVLKLMRKGVTAIQNLQLLKLCAQYGVTPAWNFLIGFPGETFADYEGVIDLIHAIPHFTPPYFLSRVRFDRFSPYFYEPENLGVRDLAPFYSYRFLYPAFNEETIFNLAYYFTGTFDGQERIAEYEVGLSEAIKNWQQNHSESDLFEIEFDDFLVVSDFRYGRDKHFHLFQAPWDSVYKQFHKITSARKVLDFAGGIPGLSADGVEGFIEYLESHQLVWREKKELLSLAIRTGYAYTPAPHHLESLEAEINSIE